MTNRSSTYAVLGPDSTASASSPNAPPDRETLQFVVDNMVRRKARFFNQAEWGVLAALSVVSTSTFSQIFLWLTDDIEADISESSVRDAFKTLEIGGYAKKVDTMASSRGPRTAMYEITPAGLEQIAQASRAPLSHAG